MTALAEGDRVAYTGPMAFPGPGHPGTVMPRSRHADDLPGEALRVSVRWDNGNRGSYLPEVLVPHVDVALAPHEPGPDLEPPPIAPDAVSAVPSFDPLALFDSTPTAFEVARSLRGRRRSDDQGTGGRRRTAPCDRGRLRDGPCVYRGDCPGRPLEAGIVASVV